MVIWMLAWPAWYRSFTDFVHSRKLPLDFFSFHHYGTSAIPETRDVSRDLARYAHFSTTEMGMDGYRSELPSSWYKGGLQDRYVAAAKMSRFRSNFLLPLFMLLT